VPAVCGLAGGFPGADTRYSTCRFAQSGHAALDFGQGRAAPCSLPEKWGAASSAAHLFRTTGEDWTLADGLGSRIAALEKEAAQICDWLHAMSGLAEPERIQAIASLQQT
jgi:hypothetical protein